MSRHRGDIYEIGLGPLFNAPVDHLSGRTDPETSRESACRLVATGRLSVDQALALQLVRDHAGRTAKELGHALAACAEMPEFRSVLVTSDPEECRQRVGRRLNELEKAGLIKREGVRDGCAIWWPVDR